MKFRQKLLLAMVWLLTLSYGIGGVLLISQSFRSSLQQEKATAVSSYEMTLQTVRLVNLVDIRQDFSSIRTALERMDAVSNQAGIQLTKNGEAIYQSGKTIDKLATASGSQLLLFSEDSRHFLQISGPVQTNDTPLQLDTIERRNIQRKTHKTQKVINFRFPIFRFSLARPTSWAHPENRSSLFGVPILDRYPKIIIRVFKTTF